MTASTPSPRIQCRFAAAFCLILFVAALTVATVLPRPAVAEQRSARKLTITVNHPSTVVSGTKVTIRCRATDQNGRIIKGAAVSFRWRLPNGTCTHARTTNGKGAASTSHTPDCGTTADYKAKVVVTARWHGQVRSATRYFTITPGGT